MPRKKSCPKPGTRKYGTKTRYTAESLKECLDKIKNCLMTQRQAAKAYNIPRSTIKNKLKEKHTKDVGRPKILSVVEENLILSHIITLADLGIPISMQDVRIIVKKYLDDNNRNESTFKDNLPGWEWGKLFLERHPSIKIRIAHNISRKRAQVNQEMLKDYFNNLNAEIEDVPPKNIFNFDETGFHDNPKKMRLIFRRQCRNPELIMNATKSCFTVMFCCNAIGEFIPPFIIYKAKQKWSNWLTGAPPNSRMAVSKSGWIDSQIFDEWFEKQLLPFIKKRQGKKIVIGDNLSSHITVNTLRLCVENDIKFVCLLPNSTHLLQPLDVSYFSSLKTNWRKVLEDWRQTKRGKIVNALPKDIFATLLTKTLELGKDTAKSNAIAGFKACGIYPFDPEAVLKKAPNYTKPIEEIQESIGESFKSFILDIRDSDLGIKQKTKFQLPVTAGKSVSVEEVEKYYEKRQKSELEKKEQVGKKKGRPLGSKNKKNQTTKDAPSSAFLRGATPPPGPSSSMLPEHNDVEALNTEIQEEHYDIITVQAEVYDQPGSKNTVENIEVPMVIEEYEVDDGILHRIEREEDKDIIIEESLLEPLSQNKTMKCATEKKDENQSTSGYCIFKYEESLFPGKVVKTDGQRMILSGMQKTIDGWKWPCRPDKVTVSRKDVIKYLKADQVVKRPGYYQISDDFLFMEWGD